MKGFFQIVYKQLGNAITGQDGRLSFPELCSVVVFVYLCYALIYHVISTGGISEDISDFTKWALLFVAGKSAIDLGKK